MAQSNEAAVETIATIIEIAIKLITVGENNFSTVAINMLPCVTVISSCDPKIPKITGMTEAAIKKKGWHDHSFTDCFFIQRSKASLHHILADNYKTQGHQNPILPLDVCFGRHLIGYKRHG
jgi:hypothetical protein